MRKREYLALVAPSVIVMFGFLVVPLYRTIQWSVQKVGYGSSGTFAGLRNYVDALSDPRFGRAVLFTVGLTVVTTVVMLVLAAVMLAHLPVIAIAFVAQKYLVAGLNAGAVKG